MSSQTPAVNISSIYPPAPAPSEKKDGKKKLKKIKGKHKKAKHKNKKLKAKLSAAKAELSLVKQQLHDREELYRLQGKLEAMEQLVRKSPKTPRKEAASHEG